MIKFDKEKVMLLQKLVIESSGGSDGIRDLNLLDSALESAFQTFDGKELYTTKEEKGARLGYGLVSNHAFVDGNKRIGLLVMISFLHINGIKIKCTDDELVDLGLSLASGAMKYEQLLKWINCHKE
ncbi:MAG: type II toxin-antitoxin system death-on-curing family toxin [Clostridia bacterium]|nr:type II toxin-antitoxin system death-on-curing family toxin [Clostridia bacterium]